MQHLLLPIAVIFILQLPGCAAPDPASGQPQELQVRKESGQKEPKPRNDKPARPTPYILPTTIQRLPPPAAAAPPRTPVMPAVPPAPAMPAPPAPVTTCDPGGCWNANGGRYNGAGGAYLDGGGRLCQRSGVWMQCF
ncbi:hypothetical protein [Noviherbaspirillum massiliense]|uniref:hypothetical protein n=1 Tax=Noviherbaspirillum massiliense TaxID=1465823 RepID=UPI0002D4D9F2|nr:hypothetical protein [Noviherbaspirillum massiliense]